MSPPPSLLDHLSSSLSSLPGSHNYHLSVLRSQPKRSHALFPHATNARTAKVYAEEVLVVLAEQRDIPPPPPQPANKADSAHAHDEPATTDKGQAAAGSLNGVEQPGDAAPATASSASTAAPPPPSAPAAENSSIESPLPPPAGASTPSASGGGPTRLVPVVGIEASLYTIPSTSTTLVYISKVDTTGLSPSLSARSNPTRALCAAFLSFHLLHPPHGAQRVRVHIFARSQGQYLFPGSVDNAPAVSEAVKQGRAAGKRVLDDKGLIRWWKATCEKAVGEVDAARKTSSAAQEEQATRMFYLIPGLSFLESLPYVPLPPSSSALSPAPWTYSHPYSSLTSPLHPPSPPSAHPLTDHLPSFPDDPKSRFLHSLTSSTVSPSGSPGDWDDVFLSLASATFTTGQQPGARRAAVDADLERERARLTDGVPGGMDEWWERMAFRQECCSGQLVAFFALAGGEPASFPPSSSFSHAPLALPPSPSKRSGTAPSASAPKPAPLALPPARYTKLWSQLHNLDYSFPALAGLAGAFERWRADVEGLGRGEWAHAHSTSGEEGEKHGGGEAFEAVFKREVAREVRVSNPDAPLLAAAGAGGAGGQKRPAEEDKPKVNVLAPRKKKKVQA
ncbi:hypothetical protein JCM10207_005503 [Rhodosporidiobolus poonsookiae]